MAYITEISEIADIEGKDKIGFLTFKNNGWGVIASKDEFKGQQWCVYCETDSVLPKRKELEFLEKRCYSEKYNGLVIRAMKMAGRISNGIAFPLNTFPEIEKLMKTGHPKEGLDVTTILGIQNRSEIDENLQLLKLPTKSSSFKWRVLKTLNRWGFFNRLTDVYKRLTGFDTSWPQGVSKTDEVRIENLRASFFSKLNQMEVSGCYPSVYVSEKRDGTSVTMALVDGKFKICSRNHCVLTLPIEEAIKVFSIRNHTETAVKLKRFISKSQMPNAIWMHIIQVLDDADPSGSNIPKFLYALRKRLGHVDVYVQGELVGPGIQKNRIDLKAPQYEIFNVGINFADGKQMKLALTEFTRSFLIGAYCDAFPGEILATPTFVPIEPLNGKTPVHLVEWKNIAKGKYGKTNNLREGIVVRFYKKFTQGEHILDILEETTWSGDGVSAGSFKVINDDYLLKTQD